MGFVYIFRSGLRNYFKIGRTKNLEKRRKELSTGNPENISLFDKIEMGDDNYDSIIENFLHKKFHNYICETGDSTEYYKIDEEELTKGIQEAREFLKVYTATAEKAKNFEHAKLSDELKESTQEAVEIFNALKKLKNESKLIELEIERFENDLKVLIGTFIGISGIASWKLQNKTIFDQKSFETQHPVLYAEFQIQKTSRVLRLEKKLHE